MQEERTSRNRSSCERGPRFVFYEGPPRPTASRPRTHPLRAPSKTLRATKAMKGLLRRAQGGLDTHGLPVEIEIEKKLGISGKSSTSRTRSASSVAGSTSSAGRVCNEYVSDWSSSASAGFWMDYDNALDADVRYIQSVWWALREMWKQGLVYKGFASRRTAAMRDALSSHELAQG